MLSGSSDCTAETTLHEFTNSYHSNIINANNFAESSTKSDLGFESGSRCSPVRSQNVTRRSLVGVRHFVKFREKLPVTGRKRNVNKSSKMSYCAMLREV